MTGRWLIGVDELTQCHWREDVVVIDCRFALTEPDAGARQYAAGHIPGAWYAHLDAGLSGTRGPHGGRHPLPDTAALARTFAAWGIDSAPPSLVVAYDDSRFAFASRLWWLLRYCGHENVRVLDGGYRAWVDAGLPIATAVPTPAQGNFVARPQPQLVVDRQQVIARRGQAGHVLVDSRETPRFLGLEEPIDPHAGHIEGACNLPWQQVADERGFFLPPDAQRQRWGDALEAENIVVYCGSGVTACVNLLALAELGRDDAQLYAGSWSDWCSYF